MSRTWMLALIGALILAACGGGDDERPRGTLVAAASAEDVTDLTADADDPAVLTVRGLPGGETVTLGLQGIERLDRVRIVVEDPFEARQVEYEGVWMADLLDVLDVSADTTIRFHALDDYTVEFERDELRSGDALLATRADRERQAVADGGPVRLVFADDSRIGQNPDLWIWSIDELTIA